MKNNLIIITTGTFKDTFTKFISHKVRLGFNVRTVCVEIIGNDYASIQTFIRNEYSRVSEPYFILLGGSLNHVAGFPIPANAGKIRFADFMYAEPTSGNLTCTVGRFPAENIAELETMCNTAINHKPKYKDIPLIIAATRPNIDFSDKLCDTSRVYIKTIGTGKVEIRTELSKEYGFVNYLGHGDSDGWCLKILSGARPKVERLKYNEIPILAKKNGHILSWACNTADLSHANCFGKAFIMNGAVTFWGACAVTWGEGNRNMAKDFWDIYNNNCPNSLGELYYQIINKHSQHAGNRGAMRYMLLGDPTLPLK